MTLHAADDAGIAAAAGHLHSGGVVAFPTETVYGLGADATQDDAVSKVFAIKGRPSFNPLILHVGRPDWLAGLALPDGRVDVLTRMFWPGPLTLVLPRRPDTPVSKHVSAGLDTVAVRQPDHPIAAKLLAATKRPLAAPSANLSGHVSPTLAEHVQSDLGDKVDMILDGGACQTGLESTVLDLTSDTARILRPGAIQATDIAALIGNIIDGTEQDDPTETGGERPITSPGQLAKHYAPSLPVRLNANSGDDKEAYLGFGESKRATLNLSAGADLAEAAAKLFAALRELDDPTRFRGIAIAPIPNTGLGVAINDRLRRAAQGR